MRLCFILVGESEKSREKTMNERPLRRVPGKNLEFSVVLKGSKSFQYGLVSNCFIFIIIISFHMI